MHVETTRRAGAHPIHRRRVTCTRRRGFEHLLAACLGVLAPLCALAPAASAQDVAGCPSELVRWAEACGSAPPRVVECPGGHAIFAVGPGRLRVDVTRRPDGAFVSLPSLGVSPVGEFSDWSEVPAADRAAFDALVRCARERPEALVGSLAATPSPPSGERPREAASAPSGPLPWKIVLAAAIALLVLVQRFGVRGVAERAAPLLALGAVTMLARVLLVPESYFHQNGHGPSWIAHALGEPSSYGPGYAEVLYWAAIRAADPDGAVFLVQGALAALLPGAAYAIARGAGAPRAAAWAAAILVALGPIGARLARGESYFATTGALLALATATVAACTRPEGGARWNAAGAGAAGLFVAQAALVHPVCWLAGALVPLAALVGPGELRARLRLAAMVTAVIAAVVILVSGMDLYAVLEGPLGAQWLGPARQSDGRIAPPAVKLAVVLALVFAVLAWRRARAERAKSETHHALPLAALCLVYAVAWRGDLLGAAPAWVHHAYDFLYLGPALAALAALARVLAAQSAARFGEARAGWVGAAALALAVLAWHATTLGAVTTLPTDAREAALMRRWREALPEGAVVVYVERAGRQITTMPLPARGQVRLGTDGPRPDLTAVGRDVFLYRSSVCSSERGRAYCDALEADYDLEPVRRAVLPAIPSMDELDYDRAEVEVVLYRVVDRRSASTTDDGSSAGREGR